MKCLECERDALAFSSFCSDHQPDYDPGEVRGFQEFDDDSPDSLLDDLDANDNEYNSEV